MNITRDTLTAIGLMCCVGQYVSGVVVIVVVVVVVVVETPPPIDNCPPHRLNLSSSYQLQPTTHVPPPQPTPLPRLTPSRQFTIIPAILRVQSPRPSNDNDIIRRTDEHDSHGRVPDHRGRGTGGKDNRHQLSLLRQILFRAGDPAEAGGGDSRR